ncbi:hypothetical protein [Helicobacter trogontum]|uniref:Alpha/beta hydrolase n=1 Tax=Helicobacter trogontum TaxID=50960 RepID=A0A4V6HZK1_9HELI|nr:hypothetical protein [Helicobacter trogontum]TLD84752.1 hypothetical protein LS81_001765 [Helicobacter trogontum]
MLKTPLVVMPQFLMQYTHMPYHTYGGNITHYDIESIQHAIELYHTKDVLIFIGGFCDTYYKVVWRAFSESLISQKRQYINDTKHFSILYMSFNCYAFLLDFIPNLNKAGYCVSVIAHSWGAKNIVRCCLDSDAVHLENLITLDCVGHFKITHRPQYIKSWENIYIANHFEHYNRANLAAIIGGAQRKIEYADINTGIAPPAHHASVSTMLHNAKLIKLQ